MSKKQIDQRSSPAQALPPSILGYPRIGAQREIKKALEAHWAGGDVQDLVSAIALHRTHTVDRLRSLGLQTESGVPYDGSVIDQVLDLSVLLGLVPQRFREAGHSAVDPDSGPGLELLAALSRGTQTLAPLELTKWFDTNYHYYVPELEDGVPFIAQPEAAEKRFSDLSTQTGSTPRPVLVGPVSFLLLAKQVGQSSQISRFDRLDELTSAYAQLLSAFHRAGAEWVQLEEPALASDGWDVPRSEVVAGLRRAYQTLGGQTDRPAIFVPVGYGYAGADALTALGRTAVEAVGLDLVAGELPPSEALRELAGKTLSAGLVDGTNVWRTEVAAAADSLRNLQSIHVGPITVGTSTSLIHVPHDVELETQLDPQVRSWLAFADQKVQEVLAFSTVLTDGPEALAEDQRLDVQRRRGRANHPQVTVEAVRRRLAAVNPSQRRRADAEHRRAAQDAHLKLPQLAATSIGSFPQTAQIRRTRAELRAGRLDYPTYEKTIRGHIADCVRRQEELGLDVLVHGEAERNDMVQYFAEHLDGFATTSHGWVQSYGSRCLRPPILFGDVRRSEPITVDWIRYADSLTSKPVKGMLTGPVTILAWSFVRNDQPLSTTADQIALALREEVDDLQAAGIQIIQVDEPALRELLPLRMSNQQDYLRWSVEAFRLATSGANPSTQLHTHLCYSEFETVIGAIDGLDADVTTLEASRSGFEVVQALSEHGFSRGIGPGVWDIHSPRVPSVEEVAERVRLAVKVLGAGTVWVNPDCGLKTRAWPETEASLRNLVEAAGAVRAELLGDTENNHPALAHR